jgi:hypothetical protein
VLARTFRHLARHPVALVLLQLPVAATSLIEPSPSAGAQNSLQLILIVSIVFPIFVFLSALSSTATLVFLRETEAGVPVSAFSALKQALSRVNRWFPAAALLALLTIPGAFSFLLIPLAVYLSAIYGFAPFYALEKPESPLSLHFKWSKTLVSKALWQMLGLAGLLMILEFGMAFWASDLGGRVGEWVGHSLWSPALSMLTQVVLAVAMSLLINPLLAVFYLKLRTEP